MHVIRICLRVKCLFGMRVEYDVCFYFSVCNRVVVRNGGMWGGGGDGDGEVKKWDVGLT